MMKHLYLIIAIYAGAGFAGPVRCIVGLSEENRVIYGYRFLPAGSPVTAHDSVCRPGNRPLLITGQIHGDERATGALLHALVQNNAFETRGRELLVIPTVNVDGAIHNTRQNARGIDLNRNFPSRAHFPLSRTLRSAENPGPISYTAPETAAVSALIKRSSAYMDVHGFQDAIYVSRAPYTANLSSYRDLQGREAALMKAYMQARVLLEKMQALFGLRYTIEDGHLNGDIGASEEYAGLMGVPSLCLEMPESHRFLYKTAISNDILNRYSNLFNSWIREATTGDKTPPTAQHKVDAKKYTH